VVLFIGCTGAGKSTFLNYLIGLELEFKKIGRKKKVEVRGEAYFPIGHTNVSETHAPKGYYCEDTDIVYIDCPGFYDNRGFEVNVSNALMVSKIVGMA